jgi:hypothetical protein
MCGYNKKLLKVQIHIARYIYFTAFYSSQKSTFVIICALRFFPAESIAVMLKWN